jgi:hypothetical protein
MLSSSRIVPFDEVLIGMLSAGLTMSQAAKQAGVSRERIRQIYNVRLSGEFGGLTGRELRRLGTLAKRQRQSRETPPRDEGAWKIWDLCKSLGIGVARIPALGRSNVRKFTTGRLLIAGRRCSIHRTQCLSLRVEHCKRRYFRTRASRWTEAEFTVVVIAGDRTLVIPQTVLKSRRFYIPERPGLPAYHHKAKVDWWAYENAWHLLSQLA